MITLAGTDAVDLHLHTLASDGFWQPADLVDWLAERAFRVVAVCDHDTQKSVIEFRTRAEKRSMICIPGVEMTVTHLDRPWHLLVYGIAPDDDSARAQQFLQLVAYQERRNQEIAEDARLRIERSGRPIPSLQQEWHGPNRLPVHVLRAMIRDGHVVRLKEAAELVVQLGGLFTTHVPMTDVVAAAHEAGGICVLAHPGRPDLGPALDEQTLKLLLDSVALDGLETNYRSYTDAQTQQLRAWADSYELLKSTGSDSHGPGQPVDPRPWHASWCQDLLARFDIDVDSTTDDWAPGIDPNVVPEPEPQTEPSESGEHAQVAVQ